MKNHNGQTLVLFILLLPILLLMAAFLIDTGNLYLEKRKLDRNVKETVTYGMNHIKEEKVEQKLNQMLLLNNTNFDHKEIQIEDNGIKITIIKTIKSIFPFFGRSKYQITIKYQGKMVEDTIQIVRG